MNEYLHRRVDLADAVDAHILAAGRLQEIGFGRYIISATTPFAPEHLSQLRTDAPGVVHALFPDSQGLYLRRGWRMLPGIDRVYVNRRALTALDWRPRYDFGHVLGCVRRGDDVFSPLARTVGSKGYHARSFGPQPYPLA